MINNERALVGLGFWLLWILASTVGYAVGYAMAIFLALIVSLEFPAVGYAAGSVFGAVIGASVGTAQWLILRRQVSWAGPWVLASTVVGAVYMVVVEAVPVSMYEAVVGAGGLAVLGASVGIAQWLILRRQVSRAGWWVLASALGLAVPVSEAVWGAEGLALDVANAGAAGLAAGGAYGAITGVVLVWLLRQPVTEGSSHPQTAV
jgi:serine/threonine-protein kinase